MQLVLFPSTVYDLGSLIWNTPGEGLFDRMQKLSRVVRTLWQGRNLGNNRSLQPQARQCAA
jgi:hypothetical protein